MSLQDCLGRYTFPHKSADGRSEKGAPWPCPNCGAAALRQFPGYCTLMEDGGLPHYMCFSCYALICTKDGPLPVTPWTKETL